MALDIKNSSTSKFSYRNTLKKGPWTTSEDMLLVEYVKKHGEGNWNAVQRNSGLMRCGKSSRLRWANHLRPNLKKGAFSTDEEKLIVELHAKFGNKWARMAAQLPGRTDNEIKNYWNTRVKRRQRGGLPIYPQDKHQEQQQQLYPSLQPASFSSLLATSNLPNPNPFCFFNSFTSTSTANGNSSYINQELKLFNDNKNTLTLSLNPAPFINLNVSNSLPLIGYSSIDFGVSSGLPSIQSAASSGEFVMETSNDDAEDYEVDLGLSNSKSGLLEDLLGESQALNGHEKAEDSLIAAAENQHEKTAFITFSHVNETCENQLEGKKQKELGEGADSPDEDLLNLLDNFPLAVPIPDWNGANGYESPNLTNGTSGTTESQRADSEYNPVATSSEAEIQDWNFGACLWNNMPSIY